MKILIGLALISGAVQLAKADDIMVQQGPERTTRERRRSGAQQEAYELPRGINWTPIMADLRGERDPGAPNRSFIDSIRRDLHRSAGVLFSDEIRHRNRPVDSIEFNPNHPSHREVLDLLRGPVRGRSDSGPSYSPRDAREEIASVVESARGGAAAPLAERMNALKGRFDTVARNLETLMVGRMAKVRVRQEDGTFRELIPSAEELTRAEQTVRDEFSEIKREIENARVIHKGLLNQEVKGKTMDAHLRDLVESVSRANEALTAINDYLRDPNGTPPAGRRGTGRAAGSLEKTRHRNP